MTVRERALDMLYLLSLSREEQAEFFPSWVPFPSEIAVDNEFIAKDLLSAASDGLDEGRTNLADFAELIAIDAMFALAPPEADLWANAPKDWLWLDEAIRAVAKRAVERLNIGPRRINENTTWVPGG
ncbi:hypothetical protein [Candidatus Viadribacter manganicus]|uniref:Uncharacterized protein n=1 Tax=Candidatus Viadribacter manganicus TaxID=1759059 RepID=A0A1B1AH54_9PROT|nr:hypothetical protein [Candidatus Viadribacter manganicus]ANP45892.1 hypothetical protein ATE48_08140 [Candidatus Viadribacter manganicus]